MPLTYFSSPLPCLPSGNRNGLSARPTPGRKLVARIRRSHRPRHDILTLRFVPQENGATHHSPLTPSNGPATSKKHKVSFKRRIPVATRTQSPSTRPPSREWRPPSRWTEFSD